MASTQRLFLSTILAVISIVALLLLLQLSVSATPDRKPDIIIRNIDVALPKPPPPVSPPQRSTSKSVFNFEGSANGISLMLDSDIQNVVTESTLEPPPIAALKPQNWDFKWSQNWQSFSIADLDRPPQLLTPLRVKFPDSLYKRGINSANASLHVLIDEKGRVILKSIKHLQYPELKLGLLSAIKMARFSPPSKDQKAVRAEFIWPVELWRD